MFTTKKASLIERKNSSTNSTLKNGFLKASAKKAAKTTSLGNGAVKFTTTGSDFVDDFGKITNYKAPRPYAEVEKTMSILWAQSPELALKELFYIRMITRTVQFNDGTRTTTTQRGQGLKHEGIFRMMWVAINHPDSFWKNITLFIAVGGWKDIITMLSYDLQYNGWDGRVLDWEKMGNVILAGLENDNTSNLLKKYLPQIKANSACKTLEAQADNIIAKWICSLLFGQKMHEATSFSYKRYRQMKTSGKAHEWQKLISQHNLLKIDFNSIHGRALSQLVSGKFLKNNKLEAAYQKWIESKPVAKFTGYPYELFTPFGTNNRPVSLDKYKEDTINKQFLGLIETAKKGMKTDSSLIVVVDSSSSMHSLVPGTKSSAYSVAKSMALYFSYLLKGVFENHFLEFSRKTILKTWKGSTPVEKYKNETSCLVEDTNFLSVADHFAKIKQQGIPESEFPTGILCVSDGCFNSTGSNKSNTEQLRMRLLAAGFSKQFVKDFKLILWDVPNNYYGKSQTAFEDFADSPNLFHISGLDPAAVAFITGTEKAGSKVPTTSEELFHAAMDQEVLDRVIV